MTFDPEYKEPVKVVNDNQQSPRLQSRADDTQNDTPPIKITLYTIDNAILKYMSERIKPIVTQNGSQVKVPVIYGDPERWKSAQRDGILRDSIGKIQLPMIMIRRNSMKKTEINSAVNKYYDRSFYSGWNRRTPYDQFSVINRINPSREYYNTTAVPDYYEITYRCLVWTEYMEQMNSIVESISFESDEFWGERNNYKFRTMISSFETLTELPNNSDRVVRTQFDMKVYAYLLPDSQLDVGGNRGLVTKKRYTTKRAVLFSELEGQESNNRGGLSSAELAALYSKTYLVIPNTSSIDEGSSVTFTITTTGVPTGARLFWNNIGTATSTDMSGSINQGEVEIINNSATVTLTTTADLLTEGSETIILRVTDPSSGGTGISTIVTVNDTSIPTTTTTSTTTTTTTALRLPQMIAAGTGHYMVLGTDSTLWSLGSNSSGQLGLGPASFGGCYTYPTQVSGTWKYIDASELSTIGIKTDGTLWMTGQTVYEAGIVTSSKGFVLVDNGPFTTASSVFQHALAIKEDGTLWSAGSNYWGELGLGNNTDTYSFTQVGSDNNWVFAHAGYTNSFAIDSNGSLWATGYNQNYQLGLGDNINRNVLTKIGSDTNWVKAYGRGAFSIGLKNNGTLWWAGDNQQGDCTSGQAVLPSVTSSVFIQVGTDADWADVWASQNAIVARKTNGTVYTWGGNNIGQIGNGTVDYYGTVCSPFLIDSGSNGWSHIYASQTSTMWAVKNNQLYFWGRNSCSLPRVGGSTSNPRTTPARYAYDTVIIITA